MVAAEPTGEESLICLKFSTISFQLNCVPGKQPVGTLKMNPNLKRNFALFPILDWILAITAHIPNKGEQLVRYYGYYSIVSHGK